MSVGLSGEAIGLGTANPNPIGGATKVTTDSGASGRGSQENFIGYRKSGSNVEPLPEDFTPAKNTITESATGNALQEPIYSVSATPFSETLTWTDKP